MPDTLVSADELAAHLNDPNWLVFDTRHDLTDPEAGTRAFAAGHIPGAQFLHLEHELGGPQAWQVSPGGQRVNGGRHPLPDRQALRERLQQRGVSDNSQVVVADAQGGMFAARLWWLLRWLGHDQVAVLDGGLPAWQAAGHPLVTTPSATPPTGRLSDRPALTRVVDVDQVFGALGTRDLQVVDARAPDRFRGENETLDPVGGHIPGARHRFFKDNLQADGRFKPAAQLQAEWSAVLAGTAADPAADTAAAPGSAAGLDKAVMQCGSGVTACHNLLALQRAGLPGSALYPGSWSEWVSDPSRPVATGPAG